MTHNYFVDCNECETKINLRAQIGFFDIPFNLHCPKCHTHIYGKLFIDQKDIGLRLEIENAHFDIGEKLQDEEYYCAELSAEFPTSKMYLRNLDNHDLPPFFRNMMFYEDKKKAIEATENAMLFTLHFENRWRKIKVLYGLFWNKKESILFPKLEKEIRNHEFIPITKVRNELDASMAMHQLLITTTGLSNALKPQTLGNYNDISKLMNIDKGILGGIQKYLYNDSPELNDLERKAFKIIDGFSELYEQLIPVVALRNATCLENVDRAKYGIMTTNFDELTNFYAKSYEWILDNINIVIALNNIVSRDDYNNCFNKKTYDSILKIGSKYKKLEYLNDKEPFSYPTNSLKNRVRNSIQHADADIDYISQKIVFRDKYRGKLKEEKMYLIDFADLCIENFSIVIYILEYYVFIEHSVRSTLSHHHAKNEPL